MELLSRFFQKQHSRTVTVVSGLPRSGTSMLMRMLEAGGIPALTDRIRAADDDNPKGYFEFEPVKRLKDGDYKWLPQAEGRAVKIIPALLPYLPADHQYRVLFLNREIKEVLASQRQMLIRRGENPDKVDDAEMTAAFLMHLEQVADWLRGQQNFSVLYLDYNRILQEPAPEIQRIVQFLDLPLDEEKMTAVIDHGLYRQRSRG